MGQPNWKRLAELGQLPDYMKGTVTTDILETQEHSLKVKNEEPNREAKVEHQNIQDVIEQMPVVEVPKDDVKEELKKKSKRELQDMLSHSGLDADGSKEELIERLLSPSIEVGQEEEKSGEFVDSLLK